MNNNSFYIDLWLKICCIAISLIVLVGGITRLTQSGLSMVDWKPITGILPPLNDSQWNEEFEKYKLFPEYEKINNFMTLSEYKKIFFWEYLHRILGRIIGLLFIIPPIFFYFKNQINKSLMRKAVFAIFLVLMQGFLGWYMVKSGLIDNPHVSHFRLASHLLLAFFLLGYTYWIRLTLNKVKLPSFNKGNLFRINLLALILFFQIVYGSFIAGTKAGKLWNTYPLMDGQLFPSQIFSLIPIYENFLNNMMMFQFMHRIIAILFVLYCGYFFYKTSSDSFIGKYTGLLFMVSINQFIIGVMTLLSGVQIELGVLHQFVAIFLILLIVKIKYLILYNDTIN